MSEASVPRIAGNSPSATRHKYLHSTILSALAEPGSEPAPAQSEERKEGRGKWMALAITAILILAALLAYSPALSPRVTMTSASPPQTSSVPRQSNSTAGTTSPYSIEIVNDSLLPGTASGGLATWAFNLFASYGGNGSWAFYPFDFDPVLRTNIAGAPPAAWGSLCGSFADPQASPCKVSGAPSAQSTSGGLSSPWYLIIKPTGAARVLLLLRLDTSYVLSALTYDPTSTSSSACGLYTGVCYHDSGPTLGPITLPAPTPMGELTFIWNSTDVLNIYPSRVASGGIGISGPGTDSPAVWFYPGFVVRMNVTIVLSCGTCPEYSLAGFRFNTTGFSLASSVSLPYSLSNQVPTSMVSAATFPISIATPAVLSGGTPSLTIDIVGG